MLFALSSVLLKCNHHMHNRNRHGVNLSRLRKSLKEQVSIESVPRTAEEKSRIAGHSTVTDKTTSYYVGVSALEFPSCQVKYIY